MSPADLARLRASVAKLEREVRAACDRWSLTEQLDASLTLMKLRRLAGLDGARVAAFGRLTKKEIAHGN